MKCVVVRLLCISALSALALFPARADDWPYYQHDAWHTVNSSSVVDPQALSLAWTAPSLLTGYSTPIMVGNNIYAMQSQQGIGNSQTTVSSLDLSLRRLSRSLT
jgi:hypothetical protein